MKQKIRSFGEVDHHLGYKSYIIPDTPDSPYIVDDSSFIPMSEAVKQLGLNPNFTGSEISTAYDFPDGKDSGIKVPVNRTKDGKDLAELSSAVYKDNEVLSDEIKKAKEFEEYKKQVNERMMADKSGTPEK